MRWFLILLLAGCPAANDDDSAGDDDDATVEDLNDARCGEAWEVVTFETSDGETLEADWLPGTAAGQGLVVLFHMIPPSNTRDGYPLHVRDAFAAEGVAVLNVDRRGAGGSTGAAIAAYQGIGGQWDMEAAVGWALDAVRECDVDPDKITLVGASNGTTSVYDYTVNHEADLPHPAAVIFMSPGGYTVGNHGFSPQQADWDVDLSFPFLWLYPTNEPWSNAFIADAPDAWRFEERGTQHGTRMFDGGQLEDDTVADMKAWIAAVQ